MIKYILKKIIFRAYLIAKIHFDEQEKISRSENFKKLAFLHESVEIDKEARVENHRKDIYAIQIGGSTKIRGHLVTFGHGGKIIIGEHCYIGEGTKIWSAKSISIGNRVLIAHNVNIHDNISHPLDSHQRHLDYLHISKIGFKSENNLREKEIVIEDDVWIGFNCVILKGVTIGKGAIIGANTVLTKDVPPYTVIAGVSETRELGKTT